MANSHIYVGMSDQDTERLQQIVQTMETLQAEADELLGVRRDVGPQVIIAKITLRLKERGIPASKAADEMGVTRQRLSKLMTGRDSIGPKVQAMLQAWLDKAAV